MQVGSFKAFSVAIIVFIMAAKVDAQAALLRRCVEPDRISLSLDEGRAGIVAVGNNGTADKSMSPQETGGFLPPDTAHYAFIDSNYLNPRWFSFIGGDAFVSVAIFPFHFNPQSTDAFGWEAGVGAEIRVKPAFVGITAAGVSDNEGVWKDGDASYHYISIYVGALFSDLHIEAGGAHGWEDGGGPKYYTSAFIGASRRFGKVFFIEPEIRILYPLAGRFIYQETYLPNRYVEVSPHFGIRDLFFGLSVKLGIGFN